LSSTIETGVLVQNRRLFRENFVDRQLIVKRMQKRMTLCHCDVGWDISAGNFFEFKFDEVSCGRQFSTAFAFCGEIQHFEKVAR
jgi:hypothetical protein